MKRRQRTWLAGALALAGVLLIPSFALAEAPQLPAPPGKTKIRVMIDAHKVAIDAQNAEVASDDADAKTTNKKGVKPDAKADKADKADKAKADKSEKAEKKETLDEKIQKGVVTIERAGTVLGVGSVLGGDGRILTALSPIGTGNDLDLRYADGTVVKAKVGHHDRTWDLALLVPQSGKWKDGLQASSKTPVPPAAEKDADDDEEEEKSAKKEKDPVIRSFTLGKANKLAFTPMVLRSIRNLLGADDKKIENVIELGSRVVPTDLGSPILDEDGKVLGMLGRGCAPAEAGKPCTPVAFGVPLTAIKSFLKNVPATAVQPAPWLGIQGIPDSNAVAKGVRVLLVHGESPAADAKLKGGERQSGDLILAVNGTPVTSPDTLAETIREFGIGEKVQLLVLSGGKYKLTNVTLKAAPEKGSSSNPAELPAAEPAEKKGFFKQ